ncbi:hypothetical protein, partial [Sansalvadorimonas verongulae]|uniref:hypothetical protein n=1 Tax=Sansalvadorimonas verongulae TaxID=2172824 RepID=UPI0018AD19FE
MSITEWQPGKLGVTLPARKDTPSFLSLDDGSARVTAPEHEIMVAFSCKNSHWDFILSQHPEIMLDHQGYTFNSTKDLETRPANDLIVIMHLIDDHKRSRVTIHTVKGLDVAGAEGEDYTLDTAERSQLIRLAPTETFVALARHVNISEPDIASVTTNPMHPNPSDKSYELLKLVADAVTDGNKASVLAQKLEEAGHPQIAERVRNKQLEITVDDQDLQQQMVYLGKHLDEYATTLALQIGMGEDDTKRVKNETMHGYVLLDRAGRMNQLYDVYKACLNI